MTDPILMRAILSMDAYFRGNSGIARMAVSGSGIGAATFYTQQANEAIGFFAQAYSLNGNIVISFRGTDRPDYGQSTDILNGWPLGGGAISSAQAIAAIEFYKNIAGANLLTNNVILTGHSLGGGLAGYVAATYGRTATVFDSMSFRNGAENLYFAASTGDSYFQNLAWNNGTTTLSPVAPDYSGIGGYYVEGEALEALFLRLGNVSYNNEIENHLPLITNPIDLHSISLLVIFLAADQRPEMGIGTDLIGASLTDALKDALYPHLFSSLSSDQVGSLISRPVGNESPGAMLQAAIAYSAIEEGERPFGDTAIRALYDDLGELAKLFAFADTTFSQAAIGRITDLIVQFAGQLAFGDVTTGTAEANLGLNGVVSLVAGQQAVMLDLTAPTWSIGADSSGIFNRSWFTVEALELLSSGTLYSFDRISFLTGSNATLDLNGRGYAHDAIVGRSSADVITVVGGNAIIFGQESDDRLSSGAGRDILDGGANNDILSAGAGEDRLIGGSGSDRLTGGLGADTYYFKPGDGQDLIAEFGDLEGGADTIRIDGGAVITRADQLEFNASGNDLIVRARDITGLVSVEIIIENMNIRTNQVELLNLYSLGGLLIGQVDLIAKWNSLAVNPGTLAPDGAGINSFPVLSYWYPVAFTDFRDGGNDNIVGTGGRDRLGGNAGNDVIQGLGGDDYLEGGNNNDRLEGGEGNDLLDAGNQADTVLGGPGNDLYLVYDLQDTLIEAANEGFDTIISSANTYTLPPNFERLFLHDAGLGFIGITGNGNELDNAIIGNLFDNTINGLGGNDRLFGGAGRDTIDGGVGDDEIWGEGGDDILNVGSGNDVANGGAGNDTINGGSGDTSTAVFSGRAEHYFATGSVSSLTIVDNRSGSPDGTDTLTGIEFLRFSDGTISIEQFLLLAQPIAFDGTENADTFGRPAENRVVIASGRGGNDVIFGADRSDTLDGGDGDDVLIGGMGNDTLIGGTGSNELIGGEGDDVYFVTATTPVEAVQYALVDFANEGLDEVRVAASIFSLEWYGANELEQLTATNDNNHAGLIGNALDNLITGGSGADELFGRAGNDLLVGGSGAANALFGQEGNDVYVVAASGDSVIEFANEGIDRVETALGVFVLRDHVEHLSHTGNVDFTGIGNAENNVLRSGMGSDFLSGLDGDDIIIGGSGADTLLGGNGVDQFRYEGGEAGFDRILDFVSGTDKIALRSAFFTPTGTVDFVSGGSVVATSANSTILYDTNTGIVWYDDDGNGAGAAVAIAQINPGQTFAAGDFLFY